MTFQISPATQDDISSMVDVNFSAFSDEHSRRLFPDTPAVRAWFAQTFERDIVGESLNTIYMIMTEDPHTPGDKRKVVALSRWCIVPAGGSVDRWEDRWATPLADGISEDTFVNEFYKPMAQQHAFVTGGRPHYFLEVLATHQEYQKLGLGSKLLQWGCEASDQVGLECYLDAAPKAKSLYEKFGFVQQTIDGSKSEAAAMLRVAKKKKG